MMRSIVQLVLLVSLTKANDVSIAPSTNPSSRPSAAPSNNPTGIPVLDFDYNFDSETGPLDWRYIDTEGNEWEKYIGLDHINLDVDGNECKSKRRPSPTNLIANAECKDQHEILTRQIRDTDCKMDDVTFYRTAHTLRADFPMTDDTCRRPTIDLPNGYPYRWLIHHLEVHLRAEHVLDGRRYDGEIQMFHLGQEDQKRELSTVSVLLDASGYQDNAKLQQYIDRWELAAALEESVNCTRRHLGSEVPRSTSRWLNSTMTGTARVAMEDEEHLGSRRMQQDGYAPRRKMFPYDLWPTIYFYRYKGSITYPPCSEIVAWRVLDEPLIISRRQYKALAKLLNGYKSCDPSRLSTTGENVRPLQQLNNEKQELSHCTSQDFDFNYYEPDKQ